MSARISPDSLAIDGAGNLYFGQSYFDVVRKLTPDGRLSTFAGTGDTGFDGDGGPPAVALLDTPMSVKVDDTGGLLISEYGNARIRRVSGPINTVAGSSHFRGDGGPALNSVLRLPDYAVQGTDGKVYLADTLNRRIRAVSTAGTIDTVVGNGEWSPKPEGVPATSSAVGTVLTMGLDPAGNLLYGGLGAVRRLAKDGTVSTIAGSTTDYGDSGDGLQGTWARFYTPSGLAWDKDGNLYIADAENNRVRKLSATDGKVSGYAGTGYYDQTGDNGPALAADIANPTSLACDSTGDLYVLSDNSQIRKIAPDGTITTPITSGVGHGIDTTPRAANTVEIGYINSLTVDSTDTLYFTLLGGIAAFKDGKVWRVAGSDTAGFGGDGSTALTAQFGKGLTVWAAPDRTLVVSDTYNHRVRVLSLADPRQVAIAGGDGQTAETGAPLAEMLSVRVIGAGGNPAPLVPVTFTVTSGSATLKPSTLMTDATGTAQTAVTLGATAGTVKINATVAGLPPLEFTATATSPANGGDQPQVAEGGITGAALSVPPVKSISPNAIATVWGQNFIAAGTQRRLTQDDLVQGRIPTLLGGLCVQFGSERAPIFDIYPGQINLQVPGVAPGTTVDVTVLRNCGLANEVASTPVKVTVATATPEFFAFSARSDGHVPVAARHNPSNVIVGPEGAYGETSLPASPGSIVTVYGTGFGLTSPAYAPGELPSTAAQPAATPVVTLGGVTLAAEDVLYVGVTPGSAGLYQLNLRVPADVADGEQPLKLQLGDAATPDGPYLLIRR